MVKEIKLFKYENLWEFNRTDLEKKKEKTIQDAKISWGNSLITAIVSIGLYYYGYQHLSIIFVICSVIFILSFLDDSQKIRMIYFIIHMKKHYEEGHENLWEYV